MRDMRAPRPSLYHTASEACDASTHDRAIEMEMVEHLTSLRKGLRKGEIMLGGSLFTQYALSEKIRVSHVTLCNWESGVSYPTTWGQWDRWARALKDKFSIPFGAFGARDMRDG